MKRHNYFVAAAAGLLFATSSSLVQATPYASNVSIDSGTKVVSFVLNQPSTTLKYSINGGTPIALDGTTTGSKSFTLGSLTDKFSIVSSNTDALGYSIPTGGTIAATTLGLSQASPAGGYNPITADTNSLLWFNSPRGVAVSNNPNAPNFGTSYISNSAAASTATPGVRALGKGLYAVHADGSDGYGNVDTAADPVTVQDGITAWAAASSNDPFRVSVGPTGDVVVADYASANANAFYLNPNMTQARYLLTGFNGNAPSVDTNSNYVCTTTVCDGTVQPAHQYHGSIEAAEVTGSLGGGNLVLYTLDEQLTSAHVSGNVSDSISNRYSIWKYTIGGSANTDTANSDPDAGSVYGFTGQPTIQANNIGGLGTFAPGGVLEDMTRGADGKLYLMQSRSQPATLAGITVADASGTKIYDSLTDSRTILANPTANDIMSTLRGFAVSPDQKWMAALLNGSDVVAIPLINGLPDLVHRLVVDTGTDIASGRDIAFDAADNIVYVSSGQQRYRVISLGGQTLTTLSYDPSLAAGSQYSFALSVITALAGDYNNDGKVDSQDYVLWRKSPGTYGGDPAGYNTWRANYGTGGPGAGSSLGGSSVPEPGTLALLMIGMTAFAAGRRKR